MSDSTYKIIELVGTSAKSWEDAAKTAVETAAKSLNDLRIAEINEMDMKIEGIVSTYFQLASHNKCMKNKITSMALVQETAIMNAQPMVGVS